MGWGLCAAVSDVGGLVVGMRQRSSPVLLSP